MPPRRILQIVMCLIRYLRPNFLQAQNTALPGLPSYFEMESPLFTAFDVTHLHQNITNRIPIWMRNKRKPFKECPNQYYWEIYNKYNYNIIRSSHAVIGDYSSKWILQAHWNVSWWITADIFILSITEFQIKIWGQTSS